MTISNQKPQSLLVQGMRTELHLHLVDVNLTTGLGVNIVWVRLFFKPPVNMTRLIQGEHVQENFNPIYRRLGLASILTKLHIHGVPVEISKGMLSLAWMVSSTLQKGFSLNSRVYTSTPRDHISSSGPLYLQYKNFSRTKGREGEPPPPNLPKHIYKR